MAEIEVTSSSTLDIQDEIKKSSQDVLESLSPISPSSLEAEANVANSEQLLTFMDYFDLDKPLETIDIATKRLHAGPEMNDTIANLIHLHASASDKFSQELSKSVSRFRPYPQSTSQSSLRDSTIGPQTHSLWTAIADYMDLMAGEATKFSSSITSKTEKDLRSFVHTDPFWCRVKDHENSLIKYGRDYDDKCIKLAKLLARSNGDSKKIAEAQAASEQARKLWEEQAKLVFEKMQAMEQTRLRILKKLIIEYQEANTNGLKVLMNNIDSRLKPRIDDFIPVEDISLICGGKPIPKHTRTFTNEVSSPLPSPSSNENVNDDSLVAQQEDIKGSKSSQLGLLRSLTKKIGSTMSLNHDKSKSSQVDSSLDDKKVSSSAENIEKHHKKEKKSKAHKKKHKHSENKTGTDDIEPSHNIHIDLVLSESKVDSEGYSIKPANADELLDEEILDNDENKPSKLVVNIKGIENKQEEDEMDDLGEIQNALIKAMGGNGLKSPLGQRSRRSSKIIIATPTGCIARTLPSSPSRENGLYIANLNIEEKMNAVIKEQNAEMVLVTGEVFIAFANDVVAKAKEEQSFIIDVKISLSSSEDNSFLNSFAQVALSRVDKFGESVEILCASKNESTVRIDLSKLIKWMTAVPSFKGPETKFSLITYQMNPKNTKRESPLKEGVIEPSIQQVIPIMVTPVWKKNDDTLNLMILVRKLSNESDGTLKLIEDLGIKIERVQCILSIPNGKTITGVQQVPEGGSFDLSTNQLIWKPDGGLALTSFDRELKFLCKADAKDITVSPTIILVDWSVRDQSISSINIEVSIDDGDGNLLDEQPITIRRTVFSGKYGCLV